MTISSRTFLGNLSASILCPDYEHQDGLIFERLTYGSGYREHETLGAIDTRKERYMAGYDYSYIVEKKRRKDSQSFLKYIKGVYKRYNIDSFYRTKYIGDSVEVYIYVDGRMPMLQLAQWNMMMEISKYSLVMNKNEKFMREVILPFINGSRDGIGNMTNMVYDLKNSLKSICADVDVSNKIVPTELIIQMDDKESIVSKYLYCG